MSLIKKQLDSFLRSILRARMERSLSKIAGSKIAELKKQGIFRSYPFGEKPPFIANCSFYRKVDAMYLDLFSSIFGQPDHGFIPLPAYYNFIEPRLNHSMLTTAIKEKNFYDLFMKDVNTPKTILRRINGGFYGSGYDFLKLDEQTLSRLLEGIPAVIIKPSVDSGSGRSIARFAKENGKYMSGKDILNVDFLRCYSNDFVMQVMVRQHEYFRRFNPESNNTVRVLTYRSVIDDSINILHSLLRIGKAGSFLDHDNLGGVAVAIGDDFRLKNTAFDVNGKSYETFNGITFIDMPEVPFMKEIHRASVDIARQIYYGRLLALDFTVDESGNVLLIEINCKGNGISQYQYSNGSLFKEFTKEILDYCDSRKTRIRIIQT